MGIKKLDWKQQQHPNMNTYKASNIISDYEVKKISCPHLHFGFTWMAYIGELHHRMRSKEACMALCQEHFEDKVTELITKQE